LVFNICEKFFVLKLAPYWSLKALHLLHGGVFYSSFHGVMIY